jgi:3-oxoadipate enol-lactonase/4-carboxymuconolactone decarboxylase
VAFVGTDFGQLYYRLEGAEGKPVLVLVHALGLDHGMWEPQVEALAPHFQLLRLDIRGHGASSVASGDATIEAIGGDVLAVADALGLTKFAFCGLSIGGMAGQWLAVHAPDRLTHLVLANTTARVADPSLMETRRRAVLDSGMSAIVDSVMGRFFSDVSTSRRSPAVSNARRVLLATNPQGYAACCAAVRDMDQRADVSRITTPTLIISGDRDVSMPWPEHGQLLASSLPDALVVRLDAAHLSNVERPRAFSAAVFHFLAGKPTDLVAAGTTVRRAVLGDAHVDRSIAATTDLNRDFQDLLTRMAWGFVWTRPGLDHRTRRLLVLAITASLGRWEEFRLHLRSGLEHELEWTDVEEALLQTAVYAGIPAGNTGFHIAMEVKRERGA